ncbi:hypothetical protein J6590_097080 [Homalodisca vitripennis]|nr:hypothetical protein J6590_097080 [Homalodisca vitripennis]
MRNTSAVDFDCRSQDRNNSVLPPNTSEGSELAGIDGIEKAVVPTNLRSKERKARLHVKLQSPSVLHSEADDTSALTYFENEAANSGFVEVKHRKRNPTQPQRNVMNRNNKFLTGRAVVNNKKLKAVEKLTYFCFTEDIRQYVSDSAKGKCEVTKLKNRLPGYSSFKAGVPLSLWKTVSDADFWPMGIYVNRFKYQKSSFVNKPTETISEAREHFLIPSKSSGIQT